MSQVDAFIQFYPAYTLGMALNEYALVFFTLLNEGYKAQYREYAMLADIALYPNMDDKSRTTFRKHLQFASKDPSDILKPSGEGSSPAELKKFFNGK